MHVPVLSIIVEDAMDGKELLHKSSLFTGMSPDEFDHIAAACELVSIDA